MQHLKDINQFDNTVIILVVGDNGASKEGTENGVANSYIRSLDKQQQIQALLRDYDKIGTSKAIANFPLGWANANNTPYRYLKQDANSEGGTHNPLIISYPNGIKEKGGIRNQFTHVNSIWPTTVELTGSKVPQVINGYVQEPAEGVSLGYTIDNAKAPSRHTTQYFEIKGSRAIYKDGWKAGVHHKDGTDFANDKWELYNLTTDFNERNDLAAQNPDKLKELQDAFDAEARKYNVYPLKDGWAAPFGLERTNAYAGSKQIVLYPGLNHTFALTGPVLANRSFSITADAEINAKTAQGVLYAIGGQFGGLSFFVKDGKLQVANNFGTVISHLESDRPIPSGKVKLQLLVDYNAAKDAKPSDKAGTQSLYINGVKVAEKPIIKGQTGAISGYDEGYDVGRDFNTSVSDRYAAPFAFTGKLNNVTIDLK